MIGWKPDERDPRDWKFQNLQVVPPRMAEIPQPEPLRYDQRPTAACVACAIAYGLHAKGWGEVSRAFIYWNGRAREHGERFDRGVTIRSALKALAALGVCDETTMPFEPERMLAPPPRAAFVEAEACAFRVSFFRIQGTPAEKVRQAKLALAGGSPVLIGTWIDPWFEGDRSMGKVFGPPHRDGVTGGHSMCVLGYGGDVFWGPQSWGPKAHGDGRFRISSAYLGWEGTRDVWAMIPGPRDGAGAPR